MKIVLATDLSEEALHAARWTFEFAKRLHEQKIPVELSILHVTSEPFYDMSQQAVFEDPDNQARMKNTIRHWLKPIVDSEKDPITHASFKYEIVFDNGNPAKKLFHWASTWHADWLIIGMSGHGAFARLMVGSTTHRLAQKPPCKMVIVHKDHDHLGVSPKFLVAIDLLDSTHGALEAAAEQARFFNARLHIIHVVNALRAVSLPNGLLAYEGGVSEMVQLEENANKDLIAVLEKNAAVLKGIKYTAEILSGYPTRAIIEYAKHNHYDAICLGSVSRSMLDEFILGSVAGGIVRNMPTTILLSPPPVKSIHR